MPLFRLSIPMLHW